MNDESNRLSNISLALGIMSITLFVFLFASITTGVLAIVFGKKSRCKSAIVTGIIGISICVALYVTMLVLFLTGVINIL